MSRIRAVLWPEVPRYAVIIATDGDTATVLHNMNGAIALLSHSAPYRVSTYAAPNSGEAMVIEPDLPEAIVNVARQFIIESAEVIPE